MCRRRPARGAGPVRGIAAPACRLWWSCRCRSRRPPGSRAASWPGRSPAGWATGRRMAAISPARASRISSSVTSLPKRVRRNTSITREAAAVPRSADIRRSSSSSSASSSSRRLRITEFRPSEKLCVLRDRPSFRRVKKPLAMSPSLHRGRGEHCHHRIPRNIGDPGAHQLPRFDRLRQPDRHEVLGMSGIRPFGQHRHASARPVRRRTVPPHAAPASRSRAARSRRSGFGTAGMRAAGRAGALAVGKHVQERQVRLLDELQRLGEQRFGFGGKAGDQVGADRDARPQRPAPARSRAARRRAGGGASSASGSGRCRPAATGADAASAAAPRRSAATGRRRSPPGPARTAAAAAVPAPAPAAAAPAARGSACRAGPGRSWRCRRRSAPAPGSRRRPGRAPAPPPRRSARCGWGRGRTG